jgi:broad specificity phosphatase PhoE
MPLKKVILVRHGQSLSNAGGLTMAHDAIPLTPLGEAQAGKLAELLPQNPSQVLASTFVRAQQTATPYCERVGQDLQVHPLAHEFSSIDPALLAGMTGKERRPIGDSYWQEADPNKRWGKNAETFQEFNVRVQEFMVESLPSLLTGSVLFGHGLWIGMLCWKLLGFNLQDSQGMKSFRRFLLGLPMPNGAVYCLFEVSQGEWKMQADETIMRMVDEVEEPFPVLDCPR